MILDDKVYVVEGRRLWTGLYDGHLSHRTIKVRARETGRQDFVTQYLPAEMVFADEAAARACLAEKHSAAVEKVRAALAKLEVFDPAAVKVCDRSQSKKGRR